jgi:DNA-binding response OmpR family regulator
MNILVVHDKRATSDRIANILCEHGYRALSLYRPVDALEHLGKVHFDLALVGVVLPNLAGLHLGRRLSDMNNPLGHWMQVILMATKELVEILRSQRTEFGYLTLPLEIEELLGKVQQIERRRAIEMQEVLEFLNESKS